MTTENGELHNSAIALLFEICDFSHDSASPEQKTHLNELLVGGYVVFDDKADVPGGRYKLTKKANQFLAERGAGPSES